MCMYPPFYVSMTNAVLMFLIFAKKQRIMFFDINACRWVIRVNACRWVIRVNACRWVICFTLIILDSAIH